MKKLLFPALITTIVILASCSKKSDTLTFNNIKEYNLQLPGKQITYKLDSMLFINFGTKDTVISYFVKDSVVAQITDNLGRTAYRIFRYQRKTATAPWVSVNTFVTVPMENAVEFIENNHRFVKLAQPLRDGYSWKGNGYIDTYSSLSDVQYMDDWDYTYESVNQQMTLGTIALDSTITVNQRDEEEGVFTNNLSDTAYSEKNLSIEKYAKGIGLVYRNFFHRQYQPARPGTGNGFKVGYGVTMTMIGHN